MSPLANYDLLDIIYPHSIYVNYIQLREVVINRKRRYNSQRRKEQAAITRQKILDSALDLFAGDGYGATTLAMIAEKAGVSLPTVTAIFGTKFSLLDNLIAQTVRGDNESGQLIERSWWQDMLNEPNPGQQLGLCSKNLRNIHQRTTDIYEIVRGAASADKELAGLLQHLGEGRLRDMRTVAESLAAKNALKPDMNLERVIDLLWVLGSAPIYRMFVVDRGWSSDQYENWLKETLIESLLANHRI